MDKLRPLCTAHSDQLRTDGALAARSVTCRVVASGLAGLRLPAVGCAHRGRLVCTAARKGVHRGILALRARPQNPRRRPSSRPSPWRSWILQPWAGVLIFAHTFRLVLRNGLFCS